MNNRLKTSASIYGVLSLLAGSSPSFAASFVPSPSPSSTTTTPVIVTAPVIAPTTPTTTQVTTNTPKPTTPSFNVPVFPVVQNTTLVPTDITQGLTGISSINKYRAPLRFDKNGCLIAPPNRDKLPLVIGDNPGARRQHLHSSGTDAIGVTVVDTGEDEAGSVYIPVAYTQPVSDSTRRENQANAATPVVVKVSKDRSSLLVFNAPYQLAAGASYGTNDALIYGLPGTVVSTHPDSITLHTGTLVIDSGDSPVRIATKSLGLKLQPHSTVLVEIKPFHPISVMAISGGEGAVHLRSRNRAGEIVSLNTGGAFFSDERDDADLWRANEESLVRSLAQTKPAGLNSLQELAFSRFVRHIGLNNAILGTGNNRATALNTVTETIFGSPLRLFARAGTEFMAPKDRNLELLSGSLFVCAPQSFCMQTELGSIFAVKPAQLNVSYDDGNLRVQSLSDPSSVAGVFGNEKIPLGWGTEVLVSDHLPSRNEVLVSDGIGRRKFGVYTLTTGDVAVLNDYSIPMLLHRASNLSSFRHAKAAADKRALNRAMKTAVAFEIATAAHGGYIVTKPTAPEMASKQPQ